MPFYGADQKCEKGCEDVITQFNIHISNVDVQMGDEICNIRHKQHNHPNRSQQHSHKQPLLGWNRAHGPEVETAEMVLRRGVGAVALGTFVPPEFLALLNGEVAVLVAEQDALALGVFVVLLSEHE